MAKIQLELNGDTYNSILNILQESFAELQHEVDRTTRFVATKLEFNNNGMTVNEADGKMLNSCLTQGLLDKQDYLLKKRDYVRGLVHEFSIGMEGITNGNN